MSALAGIFGSLIGRAALSGAVGAKSAVPQAIGKTGETATKSAVPNNLTMSVKHLMSAPGRLLRMREHQFQANLPSTPAIYKKIHQDEADYEKRKLGESTAALGMALKGAGKGFVGLAATLIAFPKIAQSLGENQLNRSIDRFGPVNAEYRNIAAAEQTSKERQTLKIGAGTEGSSKALQEAVANLRNKSTESMTALRNAGNLIAISAVNTAAAFMEGLEKTGIAKAFNDMMGRDPNAAKKIERNPQDEFIEDVLRGRYIPKKHRLPPPPKLGK